VRLPDTRTETSKLPPFYQLSQDPVSNTPTNCPQSPFSCRMRICQSIPFFLSVNFFLVAQILAQSPQCNKDFGFLPSITIDKLRQSSPSHSGPAQGHCEVDNSTERKAIQALKRSVRLIDYIDRLRLVLEMCIDGGTQRGGAIGHWKA